MVAAIVVVVVAVAAVRFDATLNTIGQDDDPDMMNTMMTKIKTTMRMTEMMIERASISMLLERIKLRTMPRAMPFVRVFSMANGKLQQPRNPEITNGVCPLSRNPSAKLQVASSDGFKMKMQMDLMAMSWLRL